MVLAVKEPLPASRATELPVGDGSWDNFLKESPFQQLLVSVAAVSAVYVLLTASSSTPDWMYLNPFLSMVSFAFAFQRVKLTMEVERIAAPAWDAMSSRNSNRWNRTELILTFPYLLSLFVLPFMAIAFQLFSVVALVFYIVLTAYHFLAVVGMRKFFGPDRQAIDKSVVFAYYNRRRWMSLFATALLLITTVLFWIGINQGAITGSIFIATLCLAVLILLEGVLEYVWDSGFFLLQENSS